MSKQIDSCEPIPFPDFRNFRYPVLNFIIFQVEYHSRINGESTIIMFEVLCAGALISSMILPIYSLIEPSGFA
jgi:hypothetical protein